MVLPMRVSELVPILQMAVGPVILISGVGLLLLSMTNRFGRVIDRSRALSAALRAAPEDERKNLASEIHILAVRGRLIRTAITLAAVSVLSAALLIIVLFVTALLGLEIALVIAGLFIACLGSLIGSLAFFIRDINLSLRALEVELSKQG